MTSAVKALYSLCFGRRPIHGSDGHFLHRAKTQAPIHY
ncbi:DUF1658 domain-containing protein [Coxiella burnetii]|nr:DUF1658 domain-containing protein [Coxiella burnetii]